MKKLFTLSLLLILNFTLFSQVYDVVFDEKGEPFGVKIFDGNSFQKFKFDNPLQDGTYEIEYNGKPLTFDLGKWDTKNQDESSLEIFEPGVIPEGDLLRALEYSPDGSMIAALYQHSDNVYFYDATSFDILAIVDVGREPMDIKITDTFAYICCHTSNEVNIIDLSNYTVSNTFEVFEYPCQIEVNLDESVVYVGCDSFLDGSVAAYNSGSGDVIFHTWDPFIHHDGAAGSMGRTSLTFTEFSLFPKNDYFIATITNGKLPSVFNAITGDHVKTFNFGGSMRATGFSVTGDTLYIYSIQAPDSMSLHRIEVGDLTVIDSIIALTSESGIIGRSNLAINSDGTKVLSGGDSWNSRYCLFDFKTFTYQYITDLNILGANKIYTSFDNDFAISQALLIARLIDLETGEILNRTPEGMPIGYAGATSPIEDKLVFSDGPFYSLHEYPYEKFYSFDFSDPLNFITDTIIYSGIEPEADMTNCAVLSIDGSKLIATNTLTDNISIIDYNTGILDTLIYMEGVSDVITIPYSNYIMLSGKDASETKIIDLANYEVIADISTGDVDEVFVTDDGKNAFTFSILSSELVSLKRIDINGASSQVVDELLVGYSNCQIFMVFSGVDMRTSTALSPDGNYMLFGGIDSNLGDVVYIVDTRIMEVVDTIAVNNDCIYGYAYTKDSKRVCVLTYDYQIPIIYLDGENSYIENEFYISDGSFSVDYNPINGLFYVLTKSNTLYLVDPLSGEIVDEYLIAAPDFSYQIGIDANGIPVVRSANNMVYENELYPLPGVSMKFSYNETNDLFIVPIPGPDKVCVFDPLVTGVDSYPKIAKSEDISVYPNPARDEIVIRSENRIENIKICDSQGRVLLNKICNTRKTEVSVRNYKEGVYCIMIQDAKKVSSRKIIISR